jgi:glycoprotein endo-alpha-1,2-mannosidase
MGMFSGRVPLLVGLCYIFIGLCVLHPVHSLEMGDKIDERYTDVWLLKVLVRTTSDWTAVDIRGSPTLISCKEKVVEGAEAPGLRYSFQCGKERVMLSLGKKQYDQTPVTFEVLLITLKGPGKGFLEITKGHIGSTVVELHLISREGNMSYSTFIHEGVNWDEPIRNPKTFEVDYTNLYRKSSGKAILERKPEHLVRKIFAFYYPWYGNPQGPSRTWFHWGPDIGRPVSRYELPTSVHYPLLGIYDSHDPDVIAAHIAMAKDSGIDGFIVSWWGIGTFEDRAFQILLKVAENMNFKATIYYESIDPHRRVTQVEGVVQELKYIVTKYGSSPAFMKIGDRPVLFLYAVEGYGRDAGFWLKVRRELEQEVGTVYLTGDTQNPSFRDVFDGFHRYGSQNPVEMGRVYDAYKSMSEFGLRGSGFEDAVGKIMRGETINIQEKVRCFTVHPGYNHTKVGRPELVLDRMGGSTYTEYWENVLKQDADCVLVTSWNEWHEGTEIEPSREHGFTYLKITKRFAELYKNKTIGQSGNPHLFVERSLTGDGSYISINVFNRGDGAAVAVTSTMKLFTGARYITSTRYTLPLDTSDELTIIVPYIRPGSNVTIKVAINPTSQAIELKPVTILYYSTHGDERYFQVGLQRYFSVAVASTNPVEVLINGTPANITTTKNVYWVIEGLDITLETRSELSLGDGVRLRFVKWSGDIDSTSPKVSVQVSKPFNILAEWVTQYYLNVKSEPQDVVNILGEGWYDAGSRVSVEADTVIVLGKGIRAVFIEWVFDGTRRPDNHISIIMDGAKTAIAKYKIQYYLAVKSDYGSPQGEGWYDAGSVATFSVTTPVGTIIQQVFTGWSGDSADTTPAATIVMDSPKRVIASWRTDYTNLYILILIITISSLALALIRLTVKRKREKV